MFETKIADLHSGSSENMVIRPLAFSPRRKFDVTNLPDTQESVPESELDVVVSTRLFSEVVQALANTVEIRDPYTDGHQKRVSLLSSEIGKQMGLPQSQLYCIRLAGLIHDIGKLVIPSEILSKPGKLSDSEFNLIKSHPYVGYDIIKVIQFPWPIAHMILQHHERVNGSGYPSGLSQQDILIEARILAVADVIDAMSSDRPYRPALGMDQALLEIIKNKSVLYDGDVVDACLRVFNQNGFKVN
jgi:HD-GYP domain-containing protein (c-di-GMP phosphodiesterase class II)